MPGDTPCDRRRGRGTVVGRVRGSPRRPTTASGSPTPTTAGPTLASRPGSWPGLGPTGPVVNVGAGTGSYEPVDRPVVAVEPSAVMIAQRPRDAAPCVQAAAEHLPFADGAFDAAMALLTVHHWSDWRAGLGELQRVAPASPARVHVGRGRPEPLLVHRRVPALRHRLRRGVPDRPRDRGGAARIADRRAADPRRLHRRLLRRLLAPTRGLPRPRGAGDHLDLRPRHPRPGRVDDGLACLAADLDSGAWHDRHADLLEADELDVGYRLVVAGA